MTRSGLTSGLRGRLLLTLLALAGGCRRGHREPTAAPPIVANAGTADAARSPPPAWRPHAAVEKWARWPMPNVPLPGLPNPHSYDTQTPGVVVDRVTGLIWQRSLPEKFYTFQDAERQCDNLALAGHRDWRLPSRIELVSLLDTTRIQPSIDMAAFPNTPIDWFWTSSLAADNPSAAWYVYFYFGYPKTDDMTNSFSVRCVRSERTPVPLGARYDVDAHQVLDLATGLQWQRVPAPKPLPFRAASAYCGQLRLGAKLGPKKGWRVPTLVELLTLIDEGAAAPMIDRAAFPDTPAEPFWSSSTFSNGNELAWYVRFDQGNGLYGRLMEAFRVRCVR
ncbi:MAG TPA: DUF1566 domain-containing protein [Polyangia bacterium]|nr:DUF1566 domain-containing protein [Polyangia bacterium]